MVRIFEKVNDISHVYIYGFRSAGAGIAEHRSETQVRNSSETVSARVSASVSARASTTIKRSSFVGFRS